MSMMCFESYHNEWWDTRRLRFASRSNQSYPFKDNSLFYKHWTLPLWHNSTRPKQTFLYCSVHSYYLQPWMQNIPVSNRKRFCGIFFIRMASPAVLIEAEWTPNSPHHRIPLTTSTLPSLLARVHSKNGAEIWRHRRCQDGGRVPAKQSKLSAASPLEVNFVRRSHKQWRPPSPLFAQLRCSLAAATTVVWHRPTQSTATSSPLWKYLRRVFCWNRCEFSGSQWDLCDPSSTASSVAVLPRFIRFGVTVLLLSVMRSPTLAGGWASVCSSDLRSETAAGWLGRESRFNLLSRTTRRIHFG